MKLHHIILLLLACAGTGIASPVTVTGLGEYHATYEQGWLDSRYFNLNLSGTDGIDTVSLAAASGFSNGGLGGPVATFQSLGFPHCCFATINGVSSERYAYQIGNGAGYLRLLAPDGTVLTSVDLVSYLATTQVIAYAYGSTIDYIHGSVVVSGAPETPVTHHPEPATWTLMGLGLIGVAVRSRWRK